MDKSQGQGHGKSEGGDQGEGEDTSQDNDHGDRSTASIGQPSTSSKSKKSKIRVERMAYYCDHCSSSFFHPSALKTHTLMKHKHIVGPLTLLEDSSTDVVQLRGNAPWYYVIDIKKQGSDWQPSPVQCPDCRRYVVKNQSLMITH